MSNRKHHAGLFPALLKHWRGKRGLSQLDLAVAADVSSRHISFMETGRSAPSAEMVLRLAATLDVPLRHANAMLRAASHEPAFPEPGPERALPPYVADAIEMMKAHHDPFPLIVMDRVYDLFDLNAGAIAMFSAAVPSMMALVARGERFNLAKLTFDPNGAHPVIANFDEVGREFLWRLKREALADPDDGELRRVLDEILHMPTVPADWRDADFTVPSSPAVPIEVLLGGRTLKFVTMVTALQAPQTVVLDELRIETWFPVDAETAHVCQELASA
ncbi:MAG: helix-turn-helix transcriptional regulator [Myxococcota bacterium]